LNPRNPIVQPVAQR